MVSRNQDIRDRNPPKFSWTREMRVVEEAARGAGRIRAVRGLDRPGMGCKRLLLRRRVIAKGPRNEADDGIQDDRRPQFAPAEHIIADGNLPIGEGGVDTFIHAFVAAADEGNPIEGGEFRSKLLIETLSLRG